MELCIRAVYAPVLTGKKLHFVSAENDNFRLALTGLYACGMSQRDISEQIKSLYDVDISPELVSKISEKIMPEVTAWMCLQSMVSMAQPSESTHTR